MADVTDDRDLILLIDDDDGFVDLVGRHLEAHGYAVATAGSVDAARQALSSGRPPALVILDINLPDDTGWSLLRSGSLREPGAPPVVIMSGTQIRPERLRQFHVAGYLPKPVSMALLTSCVARFTGSQAGAVLPDATEVLG